MGFAKGRNHEALHVLCISHEKLSRFWCLARSLSLSWQRWCPESSSATRRGGCRGWLLGPYRSQCFVPSRLLTEACCSVVVTRANLGTVLNCLHFGPLGANSTVRVPFAHPHSLIKLGAHLCCGGDWPKGCHGDLGSTSLPWDTGGIKIGYGHSSGSQTQDLVMHLGGLMASPLPPTAGSPLRVPGAEAGAAADSLPQRQAQQGHGQRDGELTTLLCPASPATLVCVKNVFK